MSEVLDPRPVRRSERLAERPAAGKRRSLVLFDNSKLSPPYDRWMPIVAPVRKAMETLGEVSIQSHDLLSFPLSAHKDWIADWHARGVDGVVFGLCDAGVTQPTVALAAATEAAGIPTAVLCTGQVIELAATSAHFRCEGLPLIVIEADRLSGAKGLASAAGAAGDEIVQALVRPPAWLTDLFTRKFPFVADLSGSQGGLGGHDFDATAQRQRMSDGLPVIAPTRQAVERMVEAGGREPDDVLIDAINPSGASLSARQAAICAVMAGTEPHCFPLVIAALEAMGDPRYKLHLASITTHSGGNVVMLSGPAARAAGVASGRGCLGPGHRANATIGRTLSLCLINVGRAIPGLSTLSLLGSPAQYTACFADDPDGPLPPLSMLLGGPGVSGALVHKCEIRNVVDHISETPESLLTTFCRVAATIGNNNSYVPSDLTLILNPEHADVLVRASWSRSDVQRFVFDNARNLRSELTGRGVKNEWPREWAGWDTIPVTPSPARIWTVVAGAPGPHSMVTVPWGYGDAVWRKVDERRGA